MATSRFLANSQEKTVTILEVNTSNRYILVKDNYGSQFTVQMSWLDPVLVVPKVGENWTVYKTGNSTWTINKKFDDGTETTPFQNLNPGDVRIESSRLIINGLSETYDTAIPEEGTYKVGDRVWNTAPSATGYIGWVCVEGGSPGTWKGFGLIAT